MSDRSVQYLLTSAVGHPFPELVRQLIQQRSARSVCDVGGGANPVLSLKEIASMRLRYVLADVSVAELAKAPSGYETRTLASAGSGIDFGEERFDLVISRFVVEHIADPVSFHNAVRGALRPGGLAAHFFPTLPSPPFVVNRLLGNRGRRLVELVQPGLRHEDGRLGKFHPYYRWCEGPTGRQYRRFASVGFDIDQYIVLVGHAYGARFSVVQRVGNAVSRVLVRLRVPSVASYAVLVLRRR